MALGQCGKVLVVEDDESMREAIETFLQAAGIETTMYATAEALLAGGADAGAACVVSDLKLPGMSGLDLLAELRSRGGWPPLILISAHDSATLRLEAERQGAAAYLAKPFLGTTCWPRSKARSCAPLTKEWSNPYSFV
jgi:FixJ family two-component response regulator